MVWSLYLIDLGATIEWVGITFMLIGLPAMLISPIAGRYVDRLGSMPFVIAGMLAMVGAGLVFALAWEPVLPSVTVTVEATLSAALATALFAMVAAGSPHGRASLAQGIYGSVATAAVIIASMAAGGLWQMGAAYPFLFYAGGVALCFVLGITVYTGVFGRFPRRPAVPAESEGRA